MLGYWSMCVCVYLFVRRYASPLHATIALLTPASTLAFNYAYEGRPYGLMLGFGATALLCWQRACETPVRTVWLLGLGLSVGAAVASHWYAILIVVPITIGECVRWRRRGRLDAWLGATLLLGTVVPVLICLPMMRHAETFRASMAASWVGVLAIVGAYQELFGRSVPLLLVILIAAAMIRVADTREAVGDSVER